MATAGNPRTGVSHAGPQLMTDVAGAFQYGVLVKADYNLLVFKRDLSTGSVTVSQTIDDTTIAGNPLNLPIDSTDDHHAIALGVDDQDRVWLAGNGHADPLRVVYSAAGDITSWTAFADPFSAVADTGVGGYTYHIFDRTEDGRLLWFFDQQESLANSRGRDWLGYYLTGATTTWTKIIGVTNGEFARTSSSAIFGVEADRVYVTGIVVYRDPTTNLEMLGVAGVWRTENTEANSQKRPWFVKSPTSTLGENTGWRSVDGTAMAMPLTWANFTAAEITTTQTFMRNYGLGIAIDASGYPHLVHQYEDQVRFEEHYYDGSAWTQRTIVGLGSGSPSIHGLPNGMLVQIVSVGGRVRLREINDGALWLVGGPVTTGTEPNVDPILRRQGRIDILIPDGDTPHVESFGNHFRAAAS